MNSYTQGQSRTQSGAQTGNQALPQPPAPPTPPTRVQNGTNTQSGVGNQNADIIIPGNNGGEPVKISVDGTGLHVSQGSSSTTIPLGKIIPPGAVQIAWAFTAVIAILAIWLPLSRFVFRKFDRRQSAVLMERQMEAMRLLEARLSALEQNIDTVAVEIERVSEVQRYTSRQLGEDPSNRQIQHAQRSDS